MKNKVITNLQNAGFRFIKTIASKNSVVLAMENQYYEDDETYYDNLVGCEITRPHYFGKRVDIVGNKNDAIASIYKHNDQEEILIKKYHFHIDEDNKKFNRKIRMLVNKYRSLL